MIFCGVSSFIRPKPHNLVYFIGKDVDTDGSHGASAARTKKAKIPEGEASRGKFCQSKRRIATNLYKC